jgi:hypothetical protein
MTTRNSVTVTGVAYVTRGLNTGVTQLREAVSADSSTLALIELKNYNPLFP